jgi:hypothetical protein
MEKERNMTTAVEQVDGIFVKSLHPGAVIDLETRSRHYRIEYVAGDEVRISGDPSFFSRPESVRLEGSTRGRGSMEPGYIGRGMRLVFGRPEEGLSITTSEIVSIWLNSPPAS